MGNILVIIIIVAILSGAIYKIYWNKKNNIMCSGCSSCPSSNKCDSLELKNGKIRKNDFSSS